MKKTTLIVWLALVFAAIAALFWHYEWVYNLPTPVPKRYASVNNGKDMGPILQLKKGSKPVFIHFFNPSCPCSRFNIKHFNSLVTEYGNEVDFRIVAMSSRSYSEKAIQERFEIPLPVSFDTSVAIACGVYSTPQAVIIDGDHQLYYRGNYNRSRYCADKKTEYARLALDALIGNKEPIVFDKYALKAYGCQLPTCYK